MFLVLAAIVLLSAHVAFGNGCGRGAFWDLEKFECTLCPPGSYQLSTNATSCIPCESGTYISHTGAQSAKVCKRCPAGTFSLAGSSYCTPCPVGSFSQERSSRCRSCPLGTYISAFGCRACENGYGDEENLLWCKDCPPGYAASRGATSVDQCFLNPCPAGTSSPGGGYCYQCGPGYFSDQPISPQCTLCQAGSIPEKFLGSTKCVPCQPGQYGKIKSLYRATPGCYACPNHTNSYSLGSRLCRRVDGPCPRGYIQTSTGDCERCETDERYDFELERCVRCPQNEGSVGGLPLRCAPCADVVRAGVGNSHCLPFNHISNLAVNQTCDPGTYIQDAEFARFCEPCDRGFFSSKSNSTECNRCPDGTVSKNPRATRCESCPDGMVPDGVAGQCVNRETGCPADTQPAANDQCVSKDCSVSEDGSYSCPPCTGSYFSSYSFEGCEACPDSQVRGYNFDCGCRGELAQNLGIIDGRCLECPAGSYGTPISEGGDNVCVKCPAGTYRVVASRGRLLSAFEHHRGYLPGPCWKCPAGFITRYDGATECEQCPPGTFSYGIGDTECLPFNAPSAPVHFNHPLDVNVMRELEKFPEWWDWERYGKPEMPLLTVAELE